MKPLPLFSALLSLSVIMTATGRGEALAAPVLTDPGARTFTFTVPAPRGLILDRDGKVLAGNRSMAVVGLRLLTLTAKEGLDDTKDGWAGVLLERVHAAGEILRASCQGVILPDAEEILDHWTHRRWLPLDVSAPLSWDAVPDRADLPEWVALQTVFLREYPHGEAGCHVVGYVSRESPIPHGPVHKEELLWPTVRGRSGLEQQFDHELSGVHGLLCVVTDEQGEETARFLVREPVPGNTLVTTLSAPMLELAGSVLKKSERRGAIVAVDSTTGDLLALTSWPQFDPNNLVPAISSEAFAALRDDPAAPLFPRAYAGEYPPGSVFKPVVGLAALRYGLGAGIGSYLPGPTKYEIDGRTFRNWNDEHEGLLDVRGALIRSCNTWFYQAGVGVGAPRILAVARNFGFGQTPSLPLKGVASGRLPKAKMNAQGTANLSIGQGELLVSPLQVAISMAGFANKTVLPGSRLISRIQSSAGIVLSDFPVRGAQRLPYRDWNLESIQAGMYGVVNHPRGTAGMAPLQDPKVLGKTGTAQWSDNGVENRLYWFAGYTHTRNPRLAFAVMCEGRDGERKFSSQVSVPVAAKFLNVLYKSPGSYGLESPSKYRAPIPATWEWNAPLDFQPSRAVAVAPSPEGTGSARPPRPRTYDSNRQAVPVIRNRQPRNTGSYDPASRLRDSRTEISTRRLRSRFNRPGPR